MAGVVGKWAAVIGTFAGVVGKFADVVEKRAGVFGKDRAGAGPEGVSAVAGRGGAYIVISSSAIEDKSCAFQAPRAGTSFANL